MLLHTNPKTTAKVSSPILFQAYGVLCRKFVGADAQRLLSGGNDRQLYLWQVGSNDSTFGSSSTSCPQVAASWQHKRKINAMALHANHMFIADTSKLVSLYSLV